MKLFFSEFKSVYNKYYFPYQVYLVREEEDDISKIFDKGFLMSRSRLNLFYLCRSIRVNLPKFSLNSENRRILRKADYLNFEVKDLKNYEYNWEIGKFAQDYYLKRFGKKVISTNKIKWLFTSGQNNYVLVFKAKTKKVGFCPVFLNNNLLNYAYPFYDNDYYEKNIGIGMMLKTIIYAKENNLQYVYLGTCYSKDSMYKLQFEGLEWFNGYEWSSDIAKLKELINNGINGHFLENVDNKDFIFKKLGIKL